MPGLPVKACLQCRESCLCPPPCSVLLDRACRAEEQQSPPHGRCSLHLLRGPRGCLHFLHLGPGCQGIAADVSLPPQPPKGILAPSLCVVGFIPFEQSRWAVQRHSPGEVPTCILYFCDRVWTSGLTCLVFPHGLCIHSFGCARAVCFVTKECKRMLVPCQCPITP